MTCIVGLISNGLTYLGADSRMTINWNAKTLTEPKVFRNGPYLIGGTGRLRTNQILRYLTLPTPNDDLPRLMATDFVDALRQGFKDKGDSRKKDEQESNDNNFLIGVHGRLFVIGSDYAITETPESYMAIGSGEDFALGSLYTTAEVRQLSPNKRLELALESAAKFNISVAAPFHYLDELEELDCTRILSNSSEPTVPISHMPNLPGLVLSAT